MEEKLIKLIKAAVKSLENEGYLNEIKDIKIEIMRPKNAEFGDYSTNVALVLAKDSGKKSLEIAQKIAERISDENMEKVEAVAPGFVNFYLSDKFLQNTVAEILKEGGKFGNSEIGRDKKVIVEFVSGNPTGPVHLGNARQAPIGDTLANVLEKNGYGAFREYYVNDFGNQVKILGHSVLGDSEAQYNGDYIKDLSKRVTSKDPFEAGQEAAKIIVSEIIKPSMEKLGVNFDNYYSEESLHKSGKIEKVFGIFKKKKLTYEKDGALWFKATEFGDDKDRVLRKSTGEITYFGGDSAYHKDKFDRGFNLAINTWGADHVGDVKRIMGAVSALGFEGKLKIIINQFVRVMKDGQEVKMSKRAGTYVSVDDLIDEAGKDAVRFFFLMHTPETHMDFDLDLAKKKSDENPVYYVQYAHARIHGILTKAKEEGINYEKADLGKLVHKKELELIKELEKLPELIRELEISYEVHRLPYYCMGLADKFHSFYDVCRVISGDDPELSKARLNLIEAVRIVLGEALRLMGINAPNKM